MEKRILGTHELRASKSGDKMLVSGYAARYNVLSHVIKPGFKERIAQGAFDRILATKPDVVALFNHNQDQVLGRTTSGTLRLNADKVGLAFELDLPNTTIGRDVYESVKRRDLNGCSFAFALGERMDEFNEEEEEENEGIAADKYRALKRKVKQIVRTIRDFASLMGISVVCSPAYPGTSIDARHELVAAECRSRVESFRKPARKPWAERFPKNRPDILDVDQAAAVRSREHRRRVLLNQI
jgi:HK97 family phage prohead protease